jgi:hypothetical protein
MGHLYASLKTGHVTASVALKRLVGFSANRGLGSIFKTEFILRYLSEPELRSMPVPASLPTGICNPRSTLRASL